MIPLPQLQKAAEEGLAFLRAQDVEEAEVFVSSNGVLLTRLNYTSHIPCNGVEEPKSTANYGTGVQAVFKPADGGARRVGVGAGTSDILLEGVGAPVHKTRQGGRAAPPLTPLAPPTGGHRMLPNYHDPNLL